MRLLAALLLMLYAASAAAHKLSTSYLQLSVQQQSIAGRWDIALRDLDYAIGLDSNGDGRLTWGEVRAKRSAIEAYALSRLSLSADGSAPCALEVQNLQITEHVDGRYAALVLTGQCADAPQQLSVQYSLLFDVDALHNGLLNLDFGQSRTGVFSQSQRSLQFQVTGLAGSSHSTSVFAQYFKSGLWHVWSGLDHMLFLAGLFLPAVLRRYKGEWLPAEKLGTALRDTAIMATAFTVAHALTLTLAATGAFAPPARWVESAVAATVLFAGLNNLLPMVYRELFWLAAGFGLIHGAAVAGALIELGLPPGSRVWALLAFNVGVEAAQLSVLLLVIPPSFLLRRTKAYRWLVFIPGAVFVSLAGLAWFLERAFGLDLGIPLP